VNVCVCASECVCVCVRVRVWVHMWMCACMYECTCACVCVCNSVCVHTGTYRHYMEASWQWCFLCGRFSVFWMQAHMDGIERTLAENGFILTPPLNMCAQTLWRICHYHVCILLTGCLPQVKQHHEWACCSVLQCVAVCCSVLQCVLVQYFAVCCSVLQCVAVYLLYNSLQDVSWHGVLFRGGCLPHIRRDSCRSAMKLS